VSSTATHGGAYAGGGSCATSIPAKLTKLAAESQGNKELAAKAEKDTVVMKERLKGLQQQCDQLSALAETLETERKSLSEQFLSTCDYKTSRGYTNLHNSFLLKEIMRLHYQYFIRIQEK
jgi:hypothetical protein